MRQQSDAVCSRQNMERRDHYAPSGVPFESGVDTIDPHGISDDLVALAVFVAVSATVGTMLSRVLEQRVRAERREREARLLHHLGIRLRSGVPTEKVLRSLARSITELFDLARCEITSEMADGPIVAEGRDGKATAGREEMIPITVQDQDLGRIVAVPNGMHPGLSAEDGG